MTQSPAGAWCRTRVRLDIRVRGVFAAPSGLLSMSMMAACASSNPAPAAAPLRWAEVRHCTEGTPTFDRLGLSSSGSRASDDEVTVRLTNTRSETVRLKSIWADVCFSECGHPAMGCNPNKAAKNVELAPAQTLELHIEPDIDAARYACTTLVLAVTATVSDSMYACEDVAAWVAVKDEAKQE